MPEYLAPGVYIEETSFRSKSIEGVSTTTTGFVGPARYGPVGQVPELLTSLGDFEYIYGDRQQMAFAAELGGGAVAAGEESHNYLWHAVRAFFTEGGKRLYVARVFRPLAGEYPPGEAALASAPSSTIDGVALFHDGHARAFLGPDAGGRAGQVQVRARFPGAAGNTRVRFTLRVGQNILGREPLASPAGAARTTIGAIAERDVVLVDDMSSPLGSPLMRSFYIARPGFDEQQQQTWSFEVDETGSPLSGPLAPLGSPPSSLPLARLNLDDTDSVRVVTLTISVFPSDGGPPAVWADLPLDGAHRRAGQPDSVFSLFADSPARADLARSLPVVIAPGTGTDSGLDLLRAICEQSPNPTAFLARLIDPDSSDLERSVEIALAGGNDGLRPGAAEYEGVADPDTTFKTGLMALEDLEDISIIAAPGASYGYERDFQADASTINSLLIAHATRMRYRIAVLDSGDGQSLTQVRAMRARLDSTYAALYYPWVRVLDPVTRQEIHLPPSGFVAGIYARNDVNRAVYKAPANEVVNLALGFEILLNKAQQDVLNPEGINCFRFFEGRGYRLWGARTISSDPEWKYVNLRRYFAYLERSIDKGTQWAVFEPNGEALWANVRRTIEDFLLNEWQSGALLGEKPEKAYFVRCDRSTMNQNDLDNGRLVCLIGVAPLRPAEFVIFRIGQWTGDRR